MTMRANKKSLNGRMAAISATLPRVESCHLNRKRCGLTNNAPCAAMRVRENGIWVNC